jgi:hypothetical protein
MYLGIHVKSSEDFLKFLEFCMTHSFDMIIPEEKDAFILDILLNEVIQTDRFNPEWARKPSVATMLQLLWQKFDSEKNPDAEKVKKLLDYVKEEPQDRLSKMYTPTEYFKTFCGYEWCNKKGEISLGSACDFVRYHMKLRDIQVRNGMVYTDEWLRNLFQDPRVSLYESEIPVLVQKLLI